MLKRSLMVFLRKQQGLRCNKRNNRTYLLQQKKCNHIQLVFKVLFIQDLGEKKLSFVGTLKKDKPLIPELLKLAK